MEFLKEIFGPSKDHIWRQLCNEIGGEFTERGFFEASKVTVRVKQWTVTLDTYTSGDSDSSTTYTRMRAPYVNPDGFRFEIYRHGWSSGLGKFVGMQDIEVGVPDFDAAFVIKGNDEGKVRQLFSNARIRQMIQYQPSIHFQVKDDEGWFGEIFPEGVDELHFEVSGVIKDITRLRALFELFAETLNHLCHIGSAYENEPQLSQSVRSSSRTLRRVGKVCIVAGGGLFCLLTYKESFAKLALWVAVPIVIIGIGLIFLARWRRSPMPTQRTAPARSNQIGRLLGCTGALLVSGVLIVGAAGYVWYRLYRADRHPDYFGKIKPPNVQQLRYFQDQEPEKLDPHLAESEQETRIIAALFDGLTDCDARGLTRPSLAERWEINNDATLWTFHLRRDAKWSDGTPLTAQDVVYSWKRALSPETASRTASLLFYLKDGAAYNQRKAEDVGVLALDNYTLQVNLEEPTAFFDKLLSQPIFRPVPRHAITRWGDKWTAPEHIVTSGAFKLAEWTQRKRLVVERNAQFWDNANTRLDRIIFVLPKGKGFEDISSEAIDLYEAGEIDAIDALPRDKTGPLRDKKDFLLGPSAATEFVIINLNIKPLDDTRVRRALSMAIDREKLTTESHGLWRSLTGFVPPLEGYEGARGDGYDPEHARRLLSEAGYPGGRGFPEIEMIFDSGSTKRPEFLQASLQRELGIQLKLNSQEFRSFLRNRTERKFNGLARGGWVPDYLDPYAFLVLLTTEGDANAGWRDTKYDELLRRANSEVDQQRRATLLREAEAYMLSQQPVIPLTYYSVYFLCKPYVKNLISNPLNQPDWRRVYVDSTITAKSLGN